MHERRVINHIGPNFKTTTLRVIRVMFCLSVFFNLATINIMQFENALEDKSVTILDPINKVLHLESLGLGSVCLLFLIGYHKHATEVSLTRLDPIDKVFTLRVIRVRYCLSFFLYLATINMHAV